MRWLPLVLVLAGCDVWVADLPPVDDPQPAAIPEVMDAGTTVDAGSLVDSGAVTSATDAGTIDAGVDAGVVVDAGVEPEVDAGTPIDAGTRTVEVLIAQGRFGRTTVSCDEGRTWILDRDEANGADCDDPGVDCWHDQWSSMGLVSSGNAVLASWGWGAVPGRVRRTSDGVTWTDVTTSTRFGAISAGAGTVVGATNPVLVSHADGTNGTWSTGGDLMTGQVTRLATFIPGGGGRFVIALDGEFRASDDLGESWFALNLPSNCAMPPALSLLASGSTLVLVHWQGTVCTSTDRGGTWTQQSLASAFSSRGVHAQGAFFLWNGATRFRSTDGLTWTSANGSPNDVAIGAVAVTSTGTFVAFKGGWQSEYQYERAYRSTDGLTWAVMPSPRSHPITHLISARLSASSACP